MKCALFNKHCDIFFHAKITHITLTHLHKIKYLKAFCPMSIIAPLNHSVHESVIDVTVYMNLSIDALLN